MFAHLPAQHPLDELGFPFCKLDFSLLQSADPVAELGVEIANLGVRKDRLLARYNHASRFAASRTRHCGHQPD